MWGVGEGLVGGNQGLRETDMTCLFSTRVVRKVLQTHCILNNHGIYLYKTHTKRMTDYYCTLYINILEIHKPVLFCSFDCFQMYS